MKNTQKHTQGPWRSNYPQITAQGSMALTVAVVLSREDNEARIGSAAKTREEAMANAQLIAAAPDLLAALKQAYDTLGWAQHFLSHANKQAIPDTLEIISAAIAKAEGNE